MTFIFIKNVGGCVDMQDNELVKQAIAAREQAYAPYSRFRVGAALLDDRNNLFTGCNIENSSYGATCCAERTAIFKAISEGAKQIKTLAVVCDSDDYCRPCGICRQVMSEFSAEDFRLLSARPDGEYEILTMEQLLPASFHLE
ncbi:MAG: cytidine deaminase [Clostridiales bacterium]|nr:cytidine deaminase [Clostridiales bacterium]